MTAGNGEMQGGTTQAAPATDPGPRRPRWPQRYTLVGLCACAVFICYIDRVNISVAAIAMQADLGWSETVKGVVLSSFFVGYLLTQIPGGWLANRFGGRWVLGAGVLLWSVFTILTPPAAMTSMALLIAVRIGMGIGEGVTFPAIYSLFSKWVPSSETSRAVASTYSGVPAGTLTALLATGLIVNSLGWPAVFYLFGGLGFVWVAVWFLRATESPETHPRVSAAEVELIRAGRAGGKGTAKVPWRELFSKAPVWALIVNHFCFNWGFYVLLSWLPSYFSGALGVDVRGAALYAAAPWVTTFAMMNVSAWLADRMLKAGRSLLFVRKLMQTIGALGPAVFLFLLRDASSAGTAVLLLCGALGLAAFATAGFAPNHLEIAPRHADVLMGITNTAGTIPGIVGVIVTGWLVDVSGSYAPAFLLAAGLYLFGAVVWLLFAAAEPVLGSPLEPNRST